MGQLIVQKYGGSSVADPEKIKSVARRVAEGAAQGHRMVVVVSAMGKTTDSLVALAQAITPTPDPREMDMVLASGEQITIGLLAMALASLGHPACSFTGPQVCMITDGVHTQASIRRITAERIQTALEAGKVVVVAGFQGMTESGDITTLGRGGSDLTGVALAAALKADVCEIFTDVDGVYTADPNVVPDARKLARVSYDEMLEMAALEAGKVVVVAGFQGMTESGDITTLGRGGSDLTGVALAAALKADVCEIFTDVDGVYTADPNVVPDARKLARVSYDEMLEMAAL